MVLEENLHTDHFKLMPDGSTSFPDSIQAAKLMPRIAIPLFHI
jgi:hypothetical protein